MKEMFVTLAKYNEEADKAVAGILGKMEEADREKDRKSYYGSLSGLYRHILGGSLFFLTTLGEAVPKNAKAVEALLPLAKADVPKGKLDEKLWKKLVADMKAVDKAYVAFAEALSDKECETKVETKYFGSVPVSYLFMSLTAHNTHHRGQISQILDSLKIENDFSGINPKLI